MFLGTRNETPFSYTTLESLTGQLVCTNDAEEISSPCVSRPPAVPTWHPLALRKIHRTGAFADTKIFLLESADWWSAARFLRSWNSQLGREHLEVHRSVVACVNKRSATPGACRVASCRVVAFSFPAVEEEGSAASIAIQHHDKIGKKPDGRCIELTTLKKQHITSLVL